MKKAIANLQNLDRLDTYITDTSLLSPNIFNITFLPEKLTLGKNLFKLKGVPDIFQPGTDLQIEILDSNGNPIYHEVVNKIDPDNSRFIAIYIYDNTPSGDCLITLAATLDSYNNESIPASWRNIVNAKWSVTTPIDTKSPNVNNIIFDSLNLPEATISNYKIRSSNWGYFKN